MSLIDTEDRGPVRHVILNRPEKRNAMSQELLLRARLGAAGRRRRRRSTASSCAARARSSPPASILSELASFAGDPGHPSPLPQRLSRLREPREAMPKPVVCQIHGACFGGALEVALGCDLRIASEGRPVRPAGGEVRDHPRRRRLDPAARRGRPRTRQGADHDREDDPRRRGRAHRPGQPRRRPPRSSRTPRRRSSRNCSPTRTSPSDAPSA